MNTSHGSHWPAPNIGIGLPNCELGSVVPTPPGVLSSITSMASSSSILSSIGSAPGKSDVVGGDNCTVLSTDGTKKAGGVYGIRANWLLLLLGWVSVSSSIAFSSMEAGNRGKEEHEEVLWSRLEGSGNFPP